MPLAELAKSAIQRALRPFGREIRRIDLTEMKRLTRFLEINRVEIVLDVGANIGQFASALRQAGFSGRIVSFEPQSRAHSALERAAANDPKWEIAPRCALGPAAGEIEINLSENSVSSSALEILEDHTQNAPQSRYVGKEKVAVMRLDDCPSAHGGARTFLKVDTQGFEMQVLRGAPRLIETLIGVQLETSLAPLYEGQPDFIELLAEMRRLGFEIWSVNPGFANRDTGRLLQADVTFFKVAK